MTNDDTGGVYCVFDSRVAVDNVEKIYKWFASEKMHGSERSETPKWERRREIARLANRVRDIYASSHEDALQISLTRFDGDTELPSKKEWVCAVRKSTNDGNDSLFVENNQDARFLFELLQSSGWNCYLVTEDVKTKSRKYKILERFWYCDEKYRRFI